MIKISEINKIKSLPQHKPEACEDGDFTYTADIIEESPDIDIIEEAKRLKRKYRNSEVRFIYDQDTDEEIRKPTTSPTISEMEDEQYKEEEIDYKAKAEEEKIKPGSLSISSIESEDKDTGRSSAKTELSGEDLEFFSYLLVEGISWGFSRLMLMFNRDANIDQRSKDRLVGVYTRGISRYNIKLSPVVSMAVVTVIVLGISARNSKPIESKNIAQDKDSNFNIPKQEKEVKYKKENKSSGIAGMMN